MKMIKNLLGVFCFLLVLMLFPQTVAASEIDFLTGGKLVSPSVVPTNDDAALAIFEHVLASESGWYIDVESCNATYTLCDLMYSGELEQQVQIIYEYDTDVKDVIDDILGNIPSGKTYFGLKDLEYFNYVVYGYDKTSMANFSSELKNYINYKNFNIDARRGTDFELYTSHSGVAKFVYDDVLYHASANSMVFYYDHLFYLENTTADERAAIENKLKSVYKDVEISVVDVNNTAEEFLAEIREDLLAEYDPENPAHSEYSTAEEYADAQMNSMFYDEEAEFYFVTDYLDNNIYSVSVGEGEDAIETFVIAVKDSTKVTSHSYVTSDISTNVSISTSNVLPLDTLIKAAKLTSGLEYNRIMGILDATNSEMFDLRLFSGAINSNITTLENGTFNVKIPVSNALKDKKLVVYYVNGEDEVEEHTVTIKDGYASFNTDHFSVYTLAETADGDAENPETGDNVTITIIMGIVSLIGLIGCGIYSQKKKFN